MMAPGALWFLLTVGLLIGAPLLVQGSRTLLQTPNIPNLEISPSYLPDEQGWANTTSVDLGAMIAYVFYVTNVGTGPAPSATIALTITNIFTLSNPNTGPPVFDPFASPQAFSFTLTPDGHTVNAFYNKSVAVGESIHFVVDVLASAVGPQQLVFGITGSARPGGGPFRIPTPAVTAPSPGICGSPGPAQDFPTRCNFNKDYARRYVCCDNQGCAGFNTDNLTPHCRNLGYVPPVNPPPTLPPSPPTGDQGVCGSGPAQYFPTRCWFNSDPQERYVCCDNQGCNGFNADNLTPHCQNAGFVPNLSAGPSPPPSPPSGDQGVCGTGPAQYFPTRCYFNNDPQGRYVCCDNQGCNGFNSDNLTPHCQAAGYVPQTL